MSFKKKSTSTFDHTGYQTPVCVTHPTTRSGPGLLSLFITLQGRLHSIIFTNVPSLRIGCKSFKFNKHTQNILKI